MVIECTDAINGLHNPQSFCLFLVLVYRAPRGGADCGEVARNFTSAPSFEGALVIEIVNRKETDDDNDSRCSFGNSLYTVRRVR